MKIILVLIMLACAFASPVYSGEKEELQKDIQIAQQHMQLLQQQMEILQLRYPQAEARLKEATAKLKSLEEKKPKEVKK